MMNQKVTEMLNDQVNKEFYSAYLYLGISTYFAAQHLDGFASWYKVQAAEEQEHAMKIYEYLIEKDIAPALKPIESVTFDYESPLAAAKAADDHEHYITGEINKIYEAAQEAKDYPTVLFLNWFITEQEEEEKNSGDMIHNIECLGDNASGLFLLDKQVGSRKN